MLRTARRFIPRSRHRPAGATTVERPPRAPPQLHAVARHRRSPNIAPSSRPSAPPSSYGDEVTVSAFGDVVPRTHLRLKLRERGMHLRRHRTSLGLFRDDLDGELSQVAEDGHRQLEHLDLALVLRSQPV